MIEADELAEAMQLLLKEVYASGNTDDFGWPAAIKACEEALSSYKKNKSVCRRCHQPLIWNDGSDGLGTGYDPCSCRVRSSEDTNDQRHLA